MPSAMSRPSEPVEIASISRASRWPSFMIEPLPNARSICASAASRALFLLSMPSFSTSFSDADIGCLLYLSHARLWSGNADKCTYFVPSGKGTNKRLIPINLLTQVLGMFCFREAIQAGSWTLPKNRAQGSDKHVEQGRSASPSASGRLNSLRGGRRTRLQALLVFGRAPGHSLVD